MRRRYKTARCILYRDDQYLLAVHNRFRYSHAPRWGLPGGQIEWGESPASAAARELTEELEIHTGDLLEIGAFSYKRALHMVYATRLDTDIHTFDDTELIDVSWFSENEVAELKSRAALHADYELEAIRELKRQLAGDAPAMSRLAAG